MAIADSPPSCVIGAGLKPAPTRPPDYRNERLRLVLLSRQFVQPRAEHALEVEEFLNHPVVYFFQRLLVVINAAVAYNRHAGRPLLVQPIPLKGFSKFRFDRFFLLLQFVECVFVPISIVTVPMSTSTLAFLPARNIGPHQNTGPVFRWKVPGCGLCFRRIREVMLFSQSVCETSEKMPDIALLVSSLLPAHC